MDTPAKGKPTKLTPAEQAALAAAAAAQAQRVVALWQFPIIADADVPVALQIPPTLWETCKRIGDTPKLFNLGRRLFARTRDLRVWLDAKAENGTPGARKKIRRAAGIA